MDCKAEVGYLNYLDHFKKKHDKCETVGNGEGTIIMGIDMRYPLQLAFPPPLVNGLLRNSQPLNIKHVKYMIYYMYWMLSKIKTFVGTKTLGTLY